MSYQGQVPLVLYVVSFVLNLAQTIRCLKQLSPVCLDIEFSCS